MLQSSQEPQTLAQELLAQRHQQEAQEPAVVAQELVVQEPVAQEPVVQVRLEGLVELG